MNQKRWINFMTIIVLAVICIHIAGIFLYKHESMNILDKQPIYFALGIGFAGLGSGILLTLLKNFILPAELNNELTSISRIKN